MINFPRKRKARRPNYSTHILPWLTSIEITWRLYSVTVWCWLTISKSDNVWYKWLLPWKLLKGHNLPRVWLASAILWWGSQATHIRVTLWYRQPNSSGPYLWGDGFSTWYSHIWPTGIHNWIFAICLLSNFSCWGKKLDWLLLVRVPDYLSWPVNTK